MKITSPPFFPSGDRVGHEKDGGAPNDQLLVVLSWSVARRSVGARV
ncbi:hypothetical protein [Streptosporangium roseum]